MPTIITEETPAENAGNSPAENAAEITVAAAVETAREAERAENALDDIREESAEIIEAAHEATETAEAVTEEVAVLWSFTREMFDALEARIAFLEGRIADMTREPEPEIEAGPATVPEIRAEPPEPEIRPRRFGRL